MPSWTKIRAEIESRQPNPKIYDEIRREKIHAVENLTGRRLVIYAVDTFISPKINLTQGGTQLSIADKDGFVEVTYGLEMDELDVLLHSPGGQIEAVESIVSILRQRFRHIRFIVPNMAKSAATVLAMSGDEILFLDARSELGPIAPQFIISRDGQTLASPAQAIIDQFEHAKTDLQKNPENLPIWLPILKQYS